MQDGRNVMNILMRLQVTTLDHFYPDDSVLKGRANRHGEPPAAGRLQNNGRQNHEEPFLYSVKKAGEAKGDLPGEARLDSILEKNPSAVFRI
jgi:hypothetical protein